MEEMGQREKPSHSHGAEKSLVGRPIISRGPQVGCFGHYHWMPSLNEGPGEIDQSGCVPYPTGFKKVLELVSTLLQCLYSLYTVCIYIPVYNPF